jgi:transcriptional regulator with XRE-family HTH domain
MLYSMSQGSKYKNQRKPKPPPTVNLKFFRLEKGLTLSAVAKLVQDEVGRDVGPGTISAIESGNRGMSAEMAAALEKALGLPERAINLQYTPTVPRGLGKGSAA